MLEINAINSPTVTNNLSKANNEVKNTKNNASFSSYLGETKTLDEIFVKASKKHNVSVNLLKAIGKAESDFRVDVVSRSGAQGVMQLMPATAKFLGVEDAFDPEQNIMGGAKYISDLLKRYDDDVKLALAAYNAGSGNVKKYGGVPPFKETQNYIKKVMNYLKQDLDANILVSNKSHDYTEDAVEVQSWYKDFNFIKNTKIEHATASLPANQQTDFPADLQTDLQPNFDEVEEIYSYTDHLKLLEDLLKDKDDDTSVAKDYDYAMYLMNLMR